MTYYQQWQIEKYGNVLPEVEPDESEEMKVEISEPVKLESDDTD